MDNTKLKLYFKDGNNQSKQLTVDYPQDNLDASTVEVAMDGMIASRVLATKNGPVATKDKAEYETILKQEIDIN